jgi:nitrilase
MNSVRTAAIQLSSTQDRERNLACADRLMTQAVERGAQLLALPENFSFLGRDGDKVKYAEEADSGPSIRFLKSFAARHDVAVVGGSVPLRCAGGTKVTNSCVVFGGAGGLVARYDKMHLFDVEIDQENTFRESRYVESGTDLVTADLLGHTMGITICYDLRFPELYRALALRGAEVLFVPSAFTRETGRDHWEVLLRARAIENLCYVVAPAQSGEHGAGRVSFGRTMIVGPWGQVLAQCQDGPGLVVCDLDFDVLADARKRLPSLTHLRMRSLK